MSPVRNALDVVGKVALAAGALAGAAYLGKYLGNTEGGSFGKLGLDDEPEVKPETVREVDPSSQVVKTSVDVTPPTTAQHYAQNVVPEQTGLVQEAKGLSPVKPTAVPSESKPATQSSVITSSQTFKPGSELEQLESSQAPSSSVRDRADELIAEYLGHVSSEQRQQSRIDKSVAEYQAGIAGRGERALKEVLKEGRQEGISPVGLGSVRAAEAFRQSPQYSEMMRSAGATTDAEELIGGTQPTTFTSVRPTPTTRIATTEPAPEVSPIVEMSTAPKSVEAQPTAPVVELPPVVTRRRSAQEEADAAFAAKALATLPKAQREALVAGQQGPQAIVTAQPAQTRLAPGGRISPNEFLSQMSQQEGPLFSYSIPAERSQAVKGLTFYPGGEIGVTMMSGGRPKEFAYATADPYRLSMHDYAEEGYPETMGSIGSIAANQAIAHQMGLQQAVIPGGKIRQERQPVYRGLMSDAEIMAAGAGKPSKKRDELMKTAQQHYETKELLNAFAQKYPQPPMSPEEISRLREERSAVKRAGLS